MYKRQDWFHFFSQVLDGVDKLVELVETGDLKYRVTLQRRGERLAFFFDLLFMKEFPGLKEAIQSTHTSDDAPDHWSKVRKNVGRAMRRGSAQAHAIVCACVCA